MAWSCRFHGEKRREKSLPRGASAARISSLTLLLLQTNMKSAGHERCTVKLSSALGTLSASADPASLKVTYSRFSGDEGDEGVTESILSSSNLLRAGNKDATDHRTPHRPEAVRRDSPAVRTFLYPMCGFGN
jgi:hypothetical protein